MSRILIRQDTAANWSTANPILARGEPALDLTNSRLKVGDGVTAWNGLPAYDPIVGLPRILCIGDWTCSIEANATTGVITMRAVGPGPVTKLLTWTPSTNALVADGKPMATQEWVSARLDGALVIGPVILAG